MFNSKREIINTVCLMMALLTNAISEVNIFEKNISIFQIAGFLIAIWNAVAKISSLIATATIIHIIRICIWIFFLFCFASIVISVHSILRNWINWLKNQFKLKALKSLNSKSFEFDKWCKIKISKKNFFSLNFVFNLFQIFAIVLISTSWIFLKKIKNKIFTTVIDALIT